MAYSSSGSTDIVVWEWEEDFGQWIPYSADNTSKIEHHYQCDPDQNVFIPIQAPSQQTILYKLNFRKLIQTNQLSRNKRRIRRRLYPATSAFANGCRWEWCGQSGYGPKYWVPYSVKASDEIERHYCTGTISSFKFQHHFQMDYEIDLINKLQINLMTGNQREIRQTQVYEKYPLDKTPQSGQMNGFTQPTGATYPHFHPQPVTTFQGLNSPGISGVGSAMPHSAQGSHSTGIPGLGSSMPNNAQASYPPYSNMSTPPGGASNLWAQMPSHQNSSGALYQGNPNPSASLNNASSTTSPTGKPSPSPPQSPSSSSTPRSSVSKKVKKSSKPVVVPLCPHGGIPCNTAASSSTVPVSQVLQKFAKKVDVDPNSTDPCAICQSNLTEDSGFGNSKETMELSLCKHVFHLECLEASYSHGVQDGSIICSTCTKMHGIKTGNQPDGTMRYSNMPNQLPGFSGCGTIQVEYHIPGGTQTANHPNPGRRFSTPGFPRYGYLPDNEDGRRVLLLLIEAWKRRLIFTVGQSTTSGMQDCVTWTSIHHKTELYTNMGHGYPDDTYLDRVTAELEAEGVTDDVL